MPIEPLRGLFDRIEAEIKPIDEQTIGAEIKQEFETKAVTPTSDAEVAELFAFAFCADYRDAGTGWGTYYGPKFVLPGSDGQMIEFPAQERINGEVLNYWKSRALEARHPSLSLRYADLFVDFYKNGTGGDGFIDMARRVIDMTIEVCERSLDDDFGYITKLGRAFEVERLIGCNHRFEDLKKVAIETEGRMAQDDKPGLWGRVFTWLLLDGKGKFTLTDQEKNNLVADIEARLQRLSQAEEPNAWAFECGANLLSQHYGASSDAAALQGVLERLEDVLRKDKHSNSNGILVTNYLQKLIDVYSRFQQQYGFAKQAVGRITAEMGNLGERGKSDMHTVSAEVQITDEQKNEFINAIFKPELQTIVERMAVHFVPRKDKVKAQLDDLSKKYVFQYLVSSKIVSEDGYALAEFGSIQDDPDQHLVHHLSKVIHFETPFLFWSFEELKKRYAPEDLYRVLAKCPLFKSEDRPYLEKILSAFWQGDFLVASALMIPFVEDAIRNLFKLNKQQYIVPNKEHGGYKLIGLHGLIKAGLIKAVYRDLGESVELYLDTLLCTPVGWNLRNNFAHGVNKMSLTGEEVANRLMHVLFCLSLIANKKEEPDGESE